MHHWPCFFEDFYDLQSREEELFLRWSAFSQFLINTTLLKYVDDIQISVNAHELPERQKAERNPIIEINKVTRDVDEIEKLTCKNALWLTVGGGIHPGLVPYDILTDREKKRDREAAMELLRFLQMHGYRIMGYVATLTRAFFNLLTILLNILW